MFDGADLSAWIVGLTVLYLSWRLAVYLDRRHHP